MQDTKIMSDLPDNSLVERHILECLQARGLGREACSYRFFNPARLEIILTTGTDRDSESRIGNSYFEEDIMRERGMDPHTDAGKVTWVTPLLMLRAPPHKGNYAIAIYDTTFLEILNGSNGFCRFRDTVNPYDALVAVFKRDLKTVHIDD